MAYTKQAPRHLIEIAKDRVEAIARELDLLSGTLAMLHEAVEETSKDSTTELVNTPSVESIRLALQYILSAHTLILRMPEEVRMKLEDVSSDLQTAAYYLFPTWEEYVDAKAKGSPL